MSKLNKHKCAKLLKKINDGTVQKNVSISLQVPNASSGSSSSSRDERAAQRANIKKERDASPQNNVPIIKDARCTGNKRKNRELDSLLNDVRQVEVLSTVSARSHRAAKRANIKKELEPSTSSPAETSTSSETKRTKIKKEASLQSNITQLSYQRGTNVPISTLVFAKVRGYRSWPSRVIRIEASNGYVVSFIGSNEIGLITLSKMYPYCEQTKAFFTSGAKSLKFQRAMQENENILHF